MESDLRYEWKHPSELGMNTYESKPLCFAMAENLAKEAGNDNAASVLPVLNKERECSSFLDWKQGFTPKEHTEMNMLERQREWQHSVDEADRKWREEQARISQAWREKVSADREAWREQIRVKMAEESRQALEASKAQFRWNIFWTVVIGGIVTGFLGVAAALVERWSWLKDW